MRWNRPAKDVFVKSVVTVEQVECRNILTVLTIKRYILIILDIQILLTMSNIMK